MVSEAVEATATTATEWHRVGRTVVAEAAAVAAAESTTRQHCQTYIRASKWLLMKLFVVYFLKKNVLCSKTRNHISIHTPPPPLYRATQWQKFWQL